MARARKSHEGLKEDVKTQDGLEPPYSARVDGHRYVIYCSMRKDGDPYGRMLILKFLSHYAARYFVTKLLKDDEYEWGKFMDRDWMIETKTTGITIRAAGNQMRDIIDYEPTEKEAEWTDAQLIGSINKFRYGRHEAAAELGTTGREVLDGDEPERQEQDDRKVDAKQPKPKREKIERAPKPDLSGFKSAGYIAKLLKVEAREVRAVLRAMKLEKPDYGWLWPKAEADKLIPKIKEGLKK